MKTTSLRPGLILFTLLAAQAAHAQTVTNLGMYAGGEFDPAYVSGNIINAGTDSSGSGANLFSTANVRWSNNVSPGSEGFTFGVGSPSTRSYYFPSYGGWIERTLLTGALTNWGMEAWVNLEKSTGVQTIMINGDGSNGYGIVTYNGRWNGLISGITFIEGPTITTGVWTHLALINEEGTTTFYVNGLAANSTTWEPYAPTDNFSLGSMPVGGNRLEGGYVDQARMFTFTGSFDTASLNIASPIPEPSTYAALAGAAALGLAAVFKHRRAFSQQTA